MGRVGHAQRSHKVRRRTHPLGRHDRGEALLERLQEVVHDRWVGPEATTRSFAKPDSATSAPRARKRLRPHSGAGTRGGGLGRCECVLSAGVITDAIATVADSGVSFGPPPANRLEL